MQAGEKLSLEQIRAFLEASEEVGFKGRNREEVYDWVNQTLRAQKYEELKRRGRGLVRRYVEKMTGLSRAQTTRLITLYLEGEPVRVGTVDGKAHAGMVWAVTDSPQPGVEFKKVEIQPEQPGDSHHRRSISSGDARTVVRRREP